MTANSKEYSLEYYHQNKEKFMRHCLVCGYCGLNIAKHNRSRKHKLKTGQPVPLTKQLINALKLVEEYQKSLA